MSISLLFFLVKIHHFGGLKHVEAAVWDGSPMAKDEDDLQVFDGRPWPTSHERCRRPGTQDIPG